MRNYEKEIKRFFKKKISFSQTLLIIFLITGSIGYAETTTIKLNDDEYPDNPAGQIYPYENKDTGKKTNNGNQIQLGGSAGGPRRALTYTNVPEHFANDNVGINLENLPMYAFDGFEAPNSEFKLEKEKEKDLKDKTGTPIKKVKYTSHGSIATGRNSYAESGGLSYGDYSIATEGGIAIGNSARNIESSGIALGPLAYNKGKKGIAIGRNTVNTGNKGIAQGYASASLKDNAIALGTNTKAEHKDSVALGANSVTVEGTNEKEATINEIKYDGFIASGTNDLPSVISIGKEGYNRQIKHLAAGIMSDKSTDAINGSQLYAVAKEVGNNRAEIEKNKIHYFSVKSSTERGNFNNDGAKNEGAIAIGKDTEAAGENSTAIGTQSKSEGTYSVAFGSYSNSKGNSSVAVGFSALAKDNNSVSIGASSNSLGFSSIAIGPSSNSTSNAAVAIGSNSKALDDSAVAIGGQAEAAGNGSVALGSSKAMKEGGIALGDSSESKEAYSIAIGSQSKAEGRRAIAIGADAESEIDNGVALGYKSKTTNGVNVDKATVNGITYSGFAGSKVNGVISVGNENFKRQIQNVAAGQITKDSTDAINGSQLYVVTNTLIDTGLKFTGNDTTKIVNRKLGETLTIKGGDNGDITITAKDTGILEVNLNKNTVIEDTNTNDDKVATTAAIKKYITDNKVTLDNNKGGATTLEGNGTKNNPYSVKVNVDETTIKIDGNKLTANTSEITGGKDGQQFEATTKTSLVTAGEVAEALNKTGFKVKVGNSTSSIKSGGQLEFTAKDGLSVSESVGTVTYGIADKGINKEKLSENLQKTLDKVDENTKNINNKADINLENITQGGKDKVKDLARESVEVVAEANSVITVTPTKDDAKHKTTYTIGIDLSKLKNTPENINLEGKYLKIDGSNIAKPTATTEEKKAAQVKFGSNVGLASLDNLADGDKTALVQAGAIKSYVDTNKVHLKSSDAGATTLEGEGTKNNPYSVKVNVDNATIKVDKNNKLTAGILTNDNFIDGTISGDKITGKTITEDKLADGLAEKYSKMSREKVSAGKGISVTSTAGEDNKDFSVSVKTSGFTTKDGKVSATTTGDTFATAEDIATELNKKVDKSYVDKGVSENSQKIAQNAKDIKELEGRVNRSGALAAALAGLHPMQYDPLNPNQIMAAMGAYRDSQAIAVGTTHYFNENLSMSAAVSMGTKTRHPDMMANLGFTYKFGDEKDDRRKNQLPERYEGKQMTSIYMMQTEMERANFKNEAQEKKIRIQENKIEAQNKELIQQKSKIENQEKTINNQKQEISDLKSRLERIEKLLEKNN